MSLRTGIIIRSTARGLATQTQEAWRGYPFDAALHVLDGDPIWPERLWPQHRPRDTFDAYLKNGEFLPHELEPFLGRVDVVFSVETLYSHSFAKMLMHRSIRAIVQGNPELWRSSQPSTLATKWVWPTPWRLDGIPDGPVLPVPAALECRAKPADLDAPLVIVHPAGHRAVGDRNGTELVVAALRLIKSEVTLRLIGQDGEGTITKGHRLALPENVTVEMCETGVADRWAMYDGAHAVLLPRRYGGLCLPAQEALQAGVVPLMTDCEPNDFWPAIRIPASKGRNQRTPFGSVPTWVCNPRFVARKIDELARDRTLLEEMRGRAQEWAEANSWARLGPMYHETFNSRL